MYGDNILLHDCPPNSSTILTAPMVFIALGVILSIGDLVPTRTSMSWAADLGPKRAICPALQ
jgi:hypothetical protein